MASADPQRIALFGGTFDPVHAGHIHIARQAVQELGIHEVVFLPCRRSPHKETDTGAGPDDRMRMLRLATGGLPWVTLSRHDLDSPPPNESWKTASHFSQQHPGAELHWILGADQWQVIHTWARPDLLRQWLVFVVHPRPGWEPPAPRKGWRAHFLDGKDHPASASKIRTRLAAGLPSSHLHPDVQRHIDTAGLYRNPDTHHAEPPK